ncbi:RHS repeat domain-containing protein [Gelidibacter japonicus]|uniref:RHS repeat domain-containing protein n=1 Tax=Gelidibacter japonicus TaxID=1962232 RepID=UPI002AFDD614|nr:RHS repeat domain-containing protein [Gelidibacter japonicus]
MKKLFHYCFVVLFAILPLALFSQSLPEIIPKSPVAQEFERQVNFPVSFYTGIPNISIDLFSFSLGEKKINISLSYLSSGIQVDQRATWVGLGWNLNAGGLITRSNKGRADENDSEYYGYSSAQGKGSELEYFLDLDKQSRTNMTTSEIEFTENFRKHAADGLYDTEPDQFTLNAMGLQGRFIINANGGIVSLDYAELIIEGNQLDGFTVRDSSGFIYRFNAIEETMFLSVPGLESDGYNSSWFLTELESPQGEKVTFTYDTELNSFSSPKHATHTYYLNSPNCGHTFNGSLNYSYVDITTKRLSRIDFEGGYLVFNALTSREDLMGGKRLDNMKAYNLLGNLVKDLDFDYEYFLSSGLNGDADSKRLKLVNLSDKKGIETQSHQFEYNNTGLPKVGSYAKDYWGYSNGKNSNNSPIPNLPDGRYSVINPYNDAVDSYDLIDDMHTNSDLNPSSVHVTAGILKKIVYPTGGQAIYKYEFNDYNYRRSSYASGGIVSEGYTAVNVARAVAATEPFLSDSQYDNESYGDLVYGISWDRQVDFVAPSTGKYRILYTLEGSGNTTASSVQLLQGYNVLFNKQNGNFATNQQDITLTGGVNYTLSALTDDDYRRSVITIQKLDFYNIYGQSPVTGGVRIESIEKRDSNGDLLLKRSYKYKEENSDNSSGVVLNSDLPYVSGLGNGMYCTPKFRISSYPLVSYGTTKGSHVGYKRVEEIYNSVSDNRSFKTVYEYTSAFDFPNDDIEFFNSKNGIINQNSDYNYAFPYTQRINNDYRRGLLKYKTVFNNNGERVSEEFYDYAFEDEELNEKIFGANFSYNSEVDYSMISGSNVSNPYELFVNYNHYSYDKIYRANLILKRTTEFLNNDNNITSIEYSYVRPLTGIVSETKSSLSNGNTIVSKVYYPDDVSGNSSLGSDLLSTEELNTINLLKSPSVNNPNGQHRITTPVQTETTVKDNIEVQLSKTTQRSSFKVWYPNIISLEAVRTSKGNNALETRLVYYDYDDKGNPLELSRTDGAHIAYLWGYNQSYPVIKLENSEADLSVVAESTSNLPVGYGTLESLLLSIENIANDSQQKLRWKTYNENLRAALPNSMVTTYTYDPLIGVTSMTDPKGYTVYYEYDSFNRLKQVIDAEGNILSKNEYNYKP